MRDAGAKVVRFRPPLPHLIRRADNRSHRRVIVVDGRIGFTGGVGIAAEWEGDAGDPDHWRDTHLRVEGPIVHSLQGAFGEHWVEATGEALVGKHFLPDIEPVRRRRHDAARPLRARGSATPTSRCSTSSRSPRPRSRSS